MGAWESYGGGTVTPQPQQRGGAWDRYAQTRNEQAAIGAISDIAASGNPVADTGMALMRQYPVNRIMQELGNRVDALGASAVQPFITPSKGPLDFSKVPQFLGNVGKAVALGQPPEGLPQGAAMYQQGRNLGLSPAWAQAAATLGGFAAAGPLNDIAGVAFEAGKPVVSALSDATGWRGANIPGSNGVTLGDVASKVSRTAGIETAAGRTAAQNLMEQARMDQARMPAFQGSTIGAEWDNAAKAAAKAEGLRTTPQAQTLKQADALEALGKTTPGQALVGLTPDQQAVVLKARAFFNPFPAQREGLGMSPWQLYGDQGYFPHEGEGNAGAARTLSELRTGPTPDRAYQMPLIEANTKAGQNFPTGGDVIARYGARQGAKMANAQFLRQFAQQRNVPGGEPIPQGNLAGFNPAVQDQLQKVGLRPDEAKFIGDQIQPGQNRIDAGLSQAGQGIIGKWKQLVTTAVPSFAERFALTHGLKTLADTKWSPKAIAITKGIMDDNPSAAGWRDEAIRAGALGHSEPADFSQTLLTPLSSVNTKLYEAMKTQYYVQSRLEGKTPLEATQATRKALGDYSRSNFTPFENSLRSGPVPFYGFTRQLLPAVARTLATKPGSMAAIAQTARNQNTRMGFSDKDWKRMGPGAEESMPVVVWRGQGADSSKVAILDPNLNPMRHFNQLLGTRGRGWRGPMDQAVSMLNPAISLPAEAWSLRSALKGQSVDPNSIVKLPSSAALIPNPEKHGIVVNANGDLGGSPELADVLWRISPPPLNAAIDAVRGAKGNAAARNAALKFSGLLPIKFVDLNQSDHFLAEQPRADLKAQRENLRSRASFLQRGARDSTAAAQ